MGVIGETDVTEARLCIGERGRESATQLWNVLILRLSHCLNVRERGLKCDFSAGCDSSVMLVFTFTVFI